MPTIYNIVRKIPAASAYLPKIKQALKGTIYYNTKKFKSISEIEAEWENIENALKPREREIMRKYKSAILLAVKTYKFLH